MTSRIGTDDFSLSSEKTRLAMLVSATRMLALEASEQEKRLPDFVVVADELALSFSDAFLLAPDLVATGLLDRDQHRLLQSIEEALTSMTERGASELWTLEALRRSSEWQDLRFKARAALRALGEPVDGGAPWPGITYVKGKDS